MKKVALYSRVSTSHHEQNTDVQIDELRRFCDSRGWTVAHVIEDYASGGTDKRDGYQRLLGLAATGEIDAIVVTKLDRLFRSLKQLITALDEFQAKGVAFVAVKDAVDYSSPSGKLFTQILGSLAEFEKALVRERTIAGLEYAKRVKGKVLGRPKRNHNLPLILHLSAQGMSIRKIARLAGCSSSTVARQLSSVSKRSAS